MATPDASLLAQSVDAFREALSGKLDEPTIAAAIDRINTIKEGHAAEGSVKSFIFYLQFELKIVNGRTFNGRGGGFASPGVSPLVGTVFTDDLRRLYDNTVSFSFFAASGTTLMFFDRSSNLLGYFLGGAIFFTGAGGGRGEWS